MVTPDLVRQAIANRMAGATICDANELTRARSALSEAAERERVLAADLEAAHARAADAEQSVAAARAAQAMAEEELARLRTNLSAKARQCKKEALNEAREALKSAHAQALFQAVRVCELEPLQTRFEHPRPPVKLLSRCFRMRGSARVEHTDQQQKIPP